MISIRTFAILAIPGATLFACSSQPGPRVPTPPVERAAAPQVVESDPPELLSIAHDIRKACGLSQTEAFFAYNSSTVEDSTTDALRRVVECFTTGPLQSKSLRLVGHTDPRGDEEYNYALGGRRASKVQERLQALGFPEPQLTASSRGESDAQGTTEDTWRADRRVDLALGS
jgi:peptidoglycan-associated lipoprotein